MEANEQLYENDTKGENPDDVLKALLCDKKLYSKLYPYQRDGVLFLFNSYKNAKSRAEGSRNGVILADEMGLGKSIQVIVFLHGMMMNAHKFKNALLVLPAGLLSDWKDKLKKWTPEMNIFIYQNTEKELPIKLRRLQKNGGILLVSYKMFIYHYKTLTTYEGMPFVWDCCVFDEAHKLKNPSSKTHKFAALTSAGFHILMTGTPIQNNLKEYWSLFSLISDTCLLGTYKTFKINFENPITKGMKADSGPGERALGMELQKILEKITEPFLLRRRKDQIQDSRVLCLPKKKEYVVWIRLSPEQEVAYRSIVDDSTILTFQSIHSLIAVCTHPRLNSIMRHEVSGVHLAESGKLAFILALLERLTANGNFVLVFSNYIKILDIIQDALTQTLWGRNTFLRIDGQNSNQRDQIVRRFQKKRSENILLLTTCVGAEGLTLTAADSVVFADLSWNQSQDAQAVGRAHRIGQTKEVTTYRLITCGTLEETMYRRQLFKGSLTRQAMGDEHNPLRHFTQEELKTFLTLQPTQFSNTQQQLKKQGAKSLKIIEIFGEGISSSSSASVCGISDHGQLLNASQGEDLEVDMARIHIAETVKMCKQEIEAESYYLTRQPTGKDVSPWKGYKKAKIRRKTQKTGTPGLPRKYKCFRTPFSGTRRKTLHISRPCVFDSSGDSSNLSADDDVNLSEKSLPHIYPKAKVRSDATGDLTDNTHTSNSICSKDNKDTEEVSEGYKSTDPNTDISFVTNLDKDSHVVDSNEDGSSITDLKKDVSSLAMLVNSSVYHEHTGTPENSKSVLDSMDNTSVSDISDSQSHKSSVSSTRDEHSPEDNNTEKSESSHLPESNISENIATDTSVPDKSLGQKNETNEFTEENSPAATFKEPRMQKIPIISEQNEIVNLNSDSYQDNPHTSPSTPCASPYETQIMILNQKDHKLQQGRKDPEVDMAEVNNKETIAISHHEIEAESHFSGQSCMDVAIRKPDKTAQFRRWSYETTTASQPGKYKAYTSPLSSTRRKTTHISRYGMFDSSDSYSLSAHEEKISERTTQNMPVTDLDMYVSTDLEKNVSSVAASVNLSVYPEHISTPENSESVLDSMNNTSASDTSGSHIHISSDFTTRYEHSFFTFPEDNNAQKSATSQLPENKNFSVNTATVDSLISISALSLVQPSDLSDLKEEANCKINKFMGRRQLQMQINGEHEECVPGTPLNLNPFFSEYPNQSTNHGPSPESQKNAVQSQMSQELQLSDSSCEDFKTDLKSNQVFPVLCDYSLTPSCFSVCVTPSTGNGKHNTKLQQLEECDVLKEEENLQDVTFTDLKGQKHNIKIFPKLSLDSSTHSSEHCQHVKPSQLGSESVQSSSEREANILNEEMADLNNEDSFKHGHTAPIPFDYSFRTGCDSLVDTSSEEKGKAVLSENFQSTPLQSGQVVHQESQCCLKTELPFSPFQQRGSSQVKLDDSNQLKRSKKRTPGLSRKYMHFPSLLVKTGRRKMYPILAENDSDSHFNQVKKHLAFSPLAQFHESTFSSTPEWKYGKENNDRRTNAFSLSSPQTGKMTQTQPGERQPLFTEDTDAELTQQGAMNRATDSNQPDIISRVNTAVSELFSTTNASVIKALRSLLISKPQHKKMRRGSLHKSKRPNFSLTSQRHKKKLMKTMKNQTIEQPQGRQLHTEDVVSDAHVSLILGEHISNLVSKKSSSFSQPGSCPKLTKEMSPIQDIHKSFQFQCIKPLNEIPEGESVRLTLTVNEYEESHHIFTDGLFTSSTQLNQVIRSSNTDINPKPQECSTANNTKSTSHEDDQDIGLKSSSQDEFFSLGHTSYVSDCDMSNGQELNSFTSADELMWEMSFPPETGSTPRKESPNLNYTYTMHAEAPKMPPRIDQAKGPLKKRTEKYSDNESGLDLTSSDMSFCSIIESKDGSHVYAEEASSQISNRQSPTKPIITAKEIDRTPGSSNASQLQNQTNSASRVTEIQSQAQDMRTYTEPPADEKESMFINEQNDTKTNMPDIHINVENEID